MVRHEKQEGSINIAWGYDEPLGGYFLSVRDERLQWTKDGSREANKIACKVTLGGEGSYFDLNTYPVGGFGYTVSLETIFDFMRRYGIDPKEIMTSST